MATNYWISVGSTDGNLVTNWSLGALATTDVLTFDNAQSTVNCICTAGWSATSLLMNTGYTGTVNPGAYSHAFSGDATLVSTCTFTASSACSITFTGASSTFTVAGSSVNMTGCALIFNGTTGCQFIDNKGVTIRTLTLGASAVLLTRSGGLTSIRSSTTPIILGNNSTLTNNTEIDSYISSSTDMYFIGTGCTINGDGEFDFILDANGLTVTLPEMNYTGTGPFYYYDTGVTSGTFTFTGNVSAYSAILESQSSTITYNFGTYNFTTSSYSSFVANGSSANVTFNFGSGTISVSSYNASVYTTGVSTLNCQSSTWIVAGNITFGSNQTINMHTSQWLIGGNWTFGSGIITHQLDKVTFIGNALLTSNGNNFNFFVINGSGKTVTMADDLTCHGYQNLAGTLNQNGHAFAVTGDWIEVAKTIR